MTIILYALLGYLAAGVVAILVLDLTTKRVRRRIKPAAADTMLLILTGGNRKTAMVVTALALLVFWPAAIYAAIRG